MFLLVLDQTDQLSLGLFRAPRRSTNRDFRSGRVGGTREVDSDFVLLLKALEVRPLLADETAAVQRGGEGDGEGDFVPDPLDKSDDSALGFFGVLFASFDGDRCFGSAGSGALLRIRIGEVDADSEVVAELGDAAAGLADDVTDGGGVDFEVEDLLGRRR
jgi:hypothetical protein